MAILCNLQAPDYWECNPQHEHGTQKWSLFEQGIFFPPWLIFRFQRGKQQFSWEPELSNIEPTHHKTQRANQKKHPPPWDVFLQRTREGRQDFLRGGLPRYRMIWGRNIQHPTYMECDLRQFSGHKQPTILRYFQWRKTELPRWWGDMLGQRKTHTTHLERMSGSKCDEVPLCFDPNFLGEIREVSLETAYSHQILGSSWRNRLEGPGHDTGCPDCCL